MSSFRVPWRPFLGLVLLVGSLTGCTALREVANLRKVQFSIDRISNPQLAGIDLSGLQSYEDLRSADVLRLGSALSEGKLPFSFTLRLDAINPKTNSMNARLTEMDWTLLLEDEKTVSGRFQQEVVLPPGEPKNIAIPITLDLARFFDENLQGLVNLASAIAGNGSPQSVKLRVQPSITTPLGPFKYPSPITVVSKDVGAGTAQP